LETVIALEIDM